jgi:hypothetical protein
MADRVGFEPTEPVKVRSISNRVLSASQSPVRNAISGIYTGVFRGIKQINYSKYILETGSL